MTDITTSPDASKRIVVGYDGSDGAHYALLYGAKLAAARNKSLLILMAQAHLSPTNTRTARALKVDPNYINEATASASAKLEAAADEVLATYPALDVTLGLVASDPAGTLAAASAVAELLVVGARGHTSEKRIPLMGGVSATVIAHAKGPVVVVPEGDHALDGGPVVTGLQDAPDSIAAAGLAVVEAEKRGVELVALYAWDIAPELGDFGALARLDPEQTHKDLDAMLVELLEPLLEGHEGVPVERRVVQGSARAALVEASKSASLIVIGSRGLGGFAGLLLGSISRSVTREAECPVIVVRNYSGE